MIVVKMKAGVVKFMNLKTWLRRFTSGFGFGGKIGSDE